VVSFFFFFTGSIAGSATRRYLSYSVTSILRFFAPQGQHVAPMGVKFGTEEGTEIIDVSEAVASFF